MPRRTSVPFSALLKKRKVGKKGKVGKPKYGTSTSMPFSSRKKRLGRVLGRRTKRRKTIRKLYRR